MIISDSRGRAGVSKLFTGSVSGKVIALASCPVLGVRRK
jgi:nucleotide-binding universal stress UspA family protein